MTTVIIIIIIIIHYLQLDRHPVAGVVTCYISMDYEDFTMGTGSFPGVKLPGRGADHPSPSSAEVMKG